MSTNVTVPQQHSGEEGASMLLNAIAVDDKFEATDAGILIRAFGPDRKDVIVCCTSIRVSSTDLPDPATFNLTDPIFPLCVRLLNNGKSLGRPVMREGHEPGSWVVSVVHATEDGTTSLEFDVEGFANNPAP